MKEATLKNMSEKEEGILVVGDCNSRMGQNGEPMEENRGGKRNGRNTRGRK